MSGVPYTFANATTTIALSNLDANFNTPVTIGNTTVGLGNTVTTIGNLTLTNATITSPTFSSPTITNNLTFSTSNAGIVFNNSSALTNSTLNDYEIGSWTATDQSGAGLSLTSTLCLYCKVGRMVFIYGYITYPTTASSANVQIGGIPFVTTGTGNYPTGVLRWSGASSAYATIEAASNYITLRSAASTSILNNAVSNSGFTFSMNYYANF